MNDSERRCAIALEAAGIEGLFQKVEPGVTEDFKTGVSGNFSSEDRGGRIFPVSIGYADRRVTNGKKQLETSAGFIATDQFIPELYFHQSGDPDAAAGCRIFLKP